MENLKGYMSIKDAAEYLGVCAETLRRWDNDGKLKAYRQPFSNYRLYKKTDLDKVLKSVKKPKS